MSCGSVLIDASHGLAWLDTTIQLTSQRMKQPEVETLGGSSCVKSAIGAPGQPVKGSSIGGYQK